MAKPLWLPEMEPVEGPVAPILARLYQRFLDDFDLVPCAFQGIPVRWDRSMVYGEVFDRGFWHLVSRNDQRTATRRFDQRRAERLPWCAPLLRNAADPEVLVWKYREGHGRVRTYVWLEQGAYVIVLEPRVGGGEEVMQLVTAYYVDGRSAERSFRRKYDQRLQ